MATKLQYVDQLKFNSSPSSSQLVLDNIFTDQYDTYFVNINQIDGNLNGYYLWMRFIDSSGNQISDSEYIFCTYQMRSNDTFSEVDSNGTTLINYVGFSGSGGLDDDRYDGGTSMYIFNPADSNSYTRVHSQCSGFNSSSQIFSLKTIGIHKSAEAVRGIRIGGHSAFYGVNMTVYGVK